MLLTIITVVRNDRDGLHRTLKSIIGQSTDAFEWLIVDGASTDDTLEALEGFDCRNLRVISEPDRGIYDAMNKGLAMASGAGVLFLNAGDELADREAAARIVADIPLLADDTAGFYGATRVIRNGIEQIIRPKIDPRWMRGAMPATHQAIVFNTSIHREHPYNLFYRISADYGAVAAMYKSGYVFARREYTISIRDGSQAGASLTHWRIALRDVWKIQKEIIGASLAERVAWALRRIAAIAITKALDHRLIHPALAQALRGK